MKIKITSILMLLLVVISCQKKETKLGGSLSVNDKLKMKLFVMSKQQDLSLKLSNTKINLTNVIDSINLKEKNNNNLTFFFTSDVCDVCEVDIFDELKKFKKANFYKDIIVLVPIQSLRDFKRFNKEYNLEINNVYAYKDKLFKNEVNVYRGAFMIMSKDGNVRDLFLPNKPLDSKRFRNYIKLLEPKYFSGIDFKI